MNKVLTLLFLTAFFNALSWVILIPVWQYPDEQSHFAQVQNFAEIGYVPASKNTSQEIVFSEEALGTARDQSGNNKYTYHPEFKFLTGQSLYGEEESSINSQDRSARVNLIKSESTNNPPLYYLLGAGTYKIFYDGNLFSRVYSVRFLSVILYLLNIFVIFKISKIIFKKDNFLKFSLTILISFMPMFVFASTGVLPDPLTNLFFGILILLSLKILVKGIKIPYIPGLIIVETLGILTRQQFLISLPICSLAILYQASKSRKQLFYVVITLFLVTSFIILLNRVGTTIPLISNVRIPDPANFDKRYLSIQKFAAHTEWTLSHTYREVLPWYWGVYKWLSLTLPHLVYQIINRLLVLAVIGIFLKFILLIKHKKVSELDRILIFMIFASLIYFLFLLIWDYFFRSKNVFSFGIQGRYFFPLIIAHFTIILIGFWQLFSLIFKRFAKYGIFLLSFSMVLFNDFSLAFIASSYYDTASLKTFVSQVSQYKPDILKGDIIFIILTLTLVTQALLLFRYGSLVYKNTADIMV